MTNDPLDISNAEQKTAIESELREWLTVDEAAQTLYHSEWNDIDARLAGDDVPVGFSKEYGQDYAALRHNQALRRRDGTYVPVNRAHSVREGILGEFVTGKRTLATTGRNTTDRQIAKAVNRYIQFVLDQNMFTDTIFMPAMDRCISKGLDWLGAEYDPYGRMFKGEFKLLRANCRDVLVDASANTSNGSFFLNDTRRTRRWKIATDEANWKLQRAYPQFWKPVSGDTFYDAPYGGTTDNQSQRNQHSTFYWTEFKHLEAAMIVGDPETGEIDIVTEGEAQRMDPKYWVGPKDHEFLYRAHLNRDAGLYHLERLPYTSFTLVPLQNIESDHRRYPLGDITVYQSLFDLVNVMATVLVKGAKSAIKGRGIGNPNIRDQNLINQINEAIANGGFAPGLTDIKYPGAPVQIISNLLGTVESWLQDVSSQHAATEGQLPARQIAEETVKLLVRQDRASHGRKDVTIRFALTQYARLLAEMVAQFVTDDDMIEVSDAAPGSPAYIPINKVLTETAYKALIADVFDIQIPQRPTDDTQVDPAQYAMQMQQAAAALQQAQMTFEKENDVKKRPAKGWKVEGEEMTDEDVARLMGDGHMNQKEFADSFDTKEAQITMYHVNMLQERKLDLNVRFEVQTDYEADQDYRTNRAFMLHKMGEMSGMDLLKEIQMPNAEEIHKNALAEKQIVQLAAELQGNPQLMQVVQQVMAQRMAAPQGAPTGGNGQ